VHEQKIQLDMERQHQQAIKEAAEAEHKTQELRAKKAAELKAQMERDEKELVKLEAKHDNLVQKLDTSKPHETAKIAAQIYKVDENIEKKASRIGQTLSVLGQFGAGMVGGVGALVGMGVAGIAGTLRKRPVVADPLPPEIMYKDGEPFQYDKKTQ